jgi:formylglycine-generating enzyme required for sulfatase activity
MKQGIITSVGLAVLVGVSPITPALAVVNIDYVSVGNPGNAADPLTGYGSVNHAYNIGKYEVTNTQYVDFLNAKGSSNSAGIYNGTMGTMGTHGSNITQSGSNGSYRYSVSSTYANMPVVGVTWFDAARFSNWLGNGQGGGDMETGAYTLSGATSGIITVNAGAKIYIPSEDEWYKAAYYNGTTSTYSLYPNGQNTITTADANYDGTGVADVGYGMASSSGTFGQAGNAWEWNDAVVSGTQRGLRGGAWDYGDYAMVSSFRNYFGPSVPGYLFGFRVASVPEPSSVVLTLLASGVLATRRKR